MTFKEKKIAFEKQAKPTESSLLRFEGVEGYDVYNCSIPFTKDGQAYIYGRVEKRSEWARSWVRLFKQIGPDHYELLPQSMIYQLEDPYISLIQNELVLGGTHVMKTPANYGPLFGYFYRGLDLEDMRYFATGPTNMKDIRLVMLKDGSIGVFSRPRGEKVQKLHGSESVVGFARIASLDELTTQVIEDAEIIDNMFAHHEWGGCNQCYLLDSGMIGIIGHKSYLDQSPQGQELSVYTNVAFVFDPERNTVVDEKIIATRSSFPDAVAKVPQLADCAFASGIRNREDDRVDLYSGLGDTHQGRVVINYPFEGFGRLVSGNIDL